MTGLDLNPDAVGRGVRRASSVSAAVRDADVVITMLPSGGHVLDC